MKQHETVNICMVEGNPHVKDQLMDYIAHGGGLESWSYLDFFLGMYEGKTLPERMSACGQHASLCIPYWEGSGRDGHCRIVRTLDHKMMACFPGPWFPKRNPAEENGLFDTCMLTLFKPWRSVAHIKSDNYPFIPHSTPFIPHSTPFSPPPRMTCTTPSRTSSFTMNAVNTHNLIALQKKK